MTSGDWPDKYAPRTFDDVVGNEEAVHDFRHFARRPDEMGHLLLYGMRGTGKTTLVNLLVDALGLKEAMKSLNASNDRGIDAMREQVVRYMRERGLIDLYGLPFKLIVLEEADQLTPEAQRMLKTPLEAYKRNCRALFLCNDRNQIIPEISDRCMEYSFSPLQRGDMLPRLSWIAGQEGVEADLEGICDLCGGSMRKAISLLQQRAISGRRQHRRLAWVDEILKQ
ncbi:MAG: AAA family ATPase [Candidatus Thermoplasmatota archaeon]|nr:AAA family ATPase [Candidatus Thermoplasmatota archaeon]MDD5777939.1 AAA family ATPase [Candidatus Thermoplasmatota archaeon]